MKKLIVIRKVLSLVLLFLLLLNMNTNASIAADEQVTNEISDIGSYGGLAIGVPGESIGVEANAGGVNLLYSSSNGLTATGSLWFDQNTPGVIGSSSPDEGFGHSLAEGDLNGDGYTDLAIGVPGEKVGNIEFAGGVHVLYGSPGGLSTTGNQWFDQNTEGVIGDPEMDSFGRSIAIGDLNGDGFADLIIGVPEDDVGAVSSAGAVNVLYGSSGGLTTIDSQWINQDTEGVIDTAEGGESFGSSLAVGDLNGDGYADLAVGVPRESIGIVANAGGVNVLYGSSGGLSASGNQWFNQNTPGIIGSAALEDQFGTALAIGDLNGDSFADLAIGVPNEQIGIESIAGGVHLLYGSSEGLSTDGSQWYDQNTEGIIGSAEVGDYFGSALAVGDLNKDGFADLVVGVRGESVGVQENAGGVNVLYGSPGGLTTTNNQWFDQNSEGVFGSAEADDYFGSSLAIGDLNGDWYADLAVGVRGESIGVEGNAGGVNILYGSLNGLSTDNSQWFDQTTEGVIGIAEAGDKFGYGLTILSAPDFSIYLPILVQ